MIKKYTNLELDSMVHQLTMVVNKDIPLAAKVSYAIARNIRKIEDAAKEYFDLKNKAVLKYGKDDGSGNISLSREDGEPFNLYLLDVAEYQSIEHEVDTMMVNVDEILKNDISPKDMMILDFMIEE